MVARPVSSSRDAGADLEAVDGDGMTPLHYAARGRGDTKIVSLPVERGVDVDAKTLHYGRGHFKCTSRRGRCSTRRPPIKATGTLRTLLG